MTDTRARVITFVGESRREREIFDGLLEDAQTYLVQNFPRLHVEPGTHYGDDGPPADAVLESEDGSRVFWNGKDWSGWQPPDRNATRTRQPDGRDEEIARLSRELEEARQANVARASDEAQQPSDQPASPALDIQDAPPA